MALIRLVSESEVTSTSTPTLPLPLPYHGPYPYPCAYPYPYPSSYPSSYPSRPYLPLVLPLRPDLLRRLALTLIGLGYAKVEAGGDGQLVGRARLLPYVIEAGTNERLHMV